MSRATAVPALEPLAAEAAQCLAGRGAAFGHPQHDGPADRPGAAVGDGDLGHDADHRDQADQLPRQLPEQQAAAEHAEDLADQLARLAVASGGEHQPVAHEQLVLGQDDHVAEVERRGEDRDHFGEARGERERRVGARGLLDDALVERGAERRQLVREAPGDRSRAARRRSRRRPPPRGARAGVVAVERPASACGIRAIDEVAQRAVEIGRSAGPAPATTITAVGIVGPPPGGLTRMKRCGDAAPSGLSAARIRSARRRLAEDRELEGRQRFAADRVEVDLADHAPDVGELERSDRHAHDRIVAVASARRTRPSRWRYGRAGCRPRSPARSRCGPRSRARAPAPRSRRRRVDQRQLAGLGR